MESWWDLGDGVGYKGKSLAMYEITCPFCLQRGNFATDQHQVKTNANGKTLNYDTLRCENCGNLTMVFGQQEIADSTIGRLFRGPFVTKDTPTLGQRTLAVIGFRRNAHRPEPI
jgi:hypothetical protein